ncbi:MAG: hypothetical protein H7Z41_00685 [Cytophagales bacterium]|nr:hypothetical protein [Armatimonadota bacterium]
MYGLLPPGTLEFLLFALVVGATLLVLRAVARRHAPPPGATPPSDAIPSLSTQQRVTGTLRRVIFDRVQGVWLAEMALGQRRITFCPTDYTDQRARYESHLGKSVDVTLYGLATLAPGGAETMQEQIKDLDKVDLSSNPVRLVRAGQFPNDYVAIARVLSHRDDALTDGTPLRVYRSEVVRTDELGLVIELAVPREDAVTQQGPVFADQTMVHGSARLFGGFAATDG